LYIALGLYSEVYFTFYKPVFFSGSEMVRVECIAEKDLWKCSVDNSPRYETVVKIVVEGREIVLLPEEGGRLVADAKAVIVNKEKGVTRIWM
jgi:hypothetical protein